MKLPVVKGFYATSFIKAFLLNALAVALVAATGIELRQLLDEEKSLAYLFFNNVFLGGGLTEADKAMIVFLGTFVFALVVYIVMYLLFGYGGGMLVSSKDIVVSIGKKGVLGALVANHH